MRHAQRHNRRWAGNVTRVGQKINAYGISVEKPEEKKTQERPKQWIDNIKIYLTETAWGGMDWYDLAQDRGQWRVLVNTVMNLRVP
jgi:hypothetical protein